MKTLNLESLNVNEAELKAFIHQKVSEIQAFSEGASVVIQMQQNDSESYAVNIRASHELGDVQAEGHGENIFEALGHAKDLVVAYFSELSNVAHEELHENKDEEKKTGTLH